jgi:hypothetical protein
MPRTIKLNEFQAMQAGELGRVAAERMAARLAEE